MYNGVLVFAQGNVWESAFYGAYCREKVLVVSATDVSSSFVTVSNMLLNKGVSPNVFIAEEGETSFFDAGRYELQRCFDPFRSVGLSVYHVIESPSLLHLLAHGDTVRAVETLDRALELMPSPQIRHSYMQTIPLIESYYQAGEFTKGNALLDDYARVLTEYFNYFIRFRGTKADRVMVELRDKLSILEVLLDLAEHYDQTEQADAIYNVVSWIYEDREEEAAERASWRGACWCSCRPSGCTSSAISWAAARRCCWATSSARR